MRILRLSLSFLASIYFTPAAAQTAVGVSIRMAPPALPVYAQPPMPAPGYLCVGRMRSLFPELTIITPKDFIFGFSVPKRNRAGSKANLGS